MYHARLHPEQYSDTFTSAQLKQLHTSILHICQTAVDLLADSSKFPDDWLFKHRWGKGKKDAATTLPNGAKITFLTVGGRTSCVVPSLQKKTGPVAADIKVKGEEDESSEVEEKKPSSKKRKLASGKEVKAEEAETPRLVKGKTKAKAKADADHDGEPKQVAKRTKKIIQNSQPNGKASASTSNTEEHAGKRRSGRVTKG